MRSHTTAKFRELLDAAPEQVRSKTEAAYRLWADNPAHPSLRYKKVHRELPIYSVRIDIDWRAVGVRRDGGMVWFWIGSDEGKPSAIPSPSQTRYRDCRRKAACRCSAGHAQ